MFSLSNNNIKIMQHIIISFILIIIQTYLPRIYITENFAISLDLFLIYITILVLLYETSYIIILSFVFALLQDFLILAGVIGLCSFIKPICVYSIGIIKKTNQLWKKRFKYIYLLTIYLFHYIFYYYVSTNNPDLTLLFVGISHSIVTLVIVLLVEKLLFNSDIL